LLQIHSGAQSLCFEDFILNIHDCHTSIIRKLMRSAKWRLQVDKRYPDPRNWPAACLLEKLAGEARELTDAQFAELRPYFKDDSQGSAWDVALTTACRSVGYARDVTDLPSFVARLIKVLHNPQTFAAA
jgi:hypothetical protein